MWIACQLCTWYAYYSDTSYRSNNSDENNNRPRRKNVTIPTVFIHDLPAAFFTYMSSDTVRLPQGTTSGFLHTNNNRINNINNNNNSNWGSDDDWSDDNDSADNDTVSNDTELSVLNEQIKTAIDKFAHAGGVMPKLNWSAPRDAVWINNGSLQCVGAGDVYLLLQASDFCQFDLQQLAQLNKQQDNDNNIILPTLALRKWCNLHPAQEFRCFVRDYALVAISQRHDTQAYEHLLCNKSLYTSLIIDFFDTIVQQRQEQIELDLNIDMPSFVFDVYIDKKERVWLLDINIWGQETDSLQYTWTELENIHITADDELPEMRVVEAGKQVRADPLSSYRAPIDTVHLASYMQSGGGETWDEFMQLCKRDNDDDDSLS